MRYKFTLIVSVHPLSVAEMRERTLMEQLTEYVLSRVPTLEFGVEPISPSWIDMKYSKRLGCRTDAPSAKRAKPREGKFLKNDFRAKRVRKQATVH